jgi:hypothetical protein
LRPAQGQQETSKKGGGEDPNRFCTVSVLEGHASRVMFAHAGNRSSDTPEGAAGMAKLFGEISKRWYAKPVASNYLLYSEPSKVAGQKFATHVAFAPHFSG